MPLNGYIVDLTMLLAAAAATYCAWRERRHPVRRWHLLLPGLLATLSAMTMVAFPHPRHLLEAQRLTLLVAALVVGLLRGRLMQLASDHAYGLVVIRHPTDSFVIAALQLLAATLEFFLDVRNHAASRS